MPNFDFKQTFIEIFKAISEKIGAEVPYGAEAKGISWPGADQKKADSATPSLRTSYSLYVEVLTTYQMPAVLWIQPAPKYVYQLFLL